MKNQPYHDGEIWVQEQAGERAMARQLAGAVSPRIMPGALPWLARQRVVAAATTGDDGQLWTSVWAGAPGFVHSLDGRQLIVQRAAIAPAAGDPVLPRLIAARQIGLVAIDFATRRRLRINGLVEAVTADEIHVHVDESLGNCPKYIQRRVPIDEPIASSVHATAADRGTALDAPRQAILAAADTAFVGSLHPERGVDASHRGGAPGFIQVVDATTLRIPDYSGNSMFLTLGNYAADPRASLAVVDFARGQVLSISGAARLHFDAERPDLPTGGTGRYWELAVREWVRFDVPALGRWELIDASPFNPPARP